MQTPFSFPIRAILVFTLVVIVSSFLWLRREPAPWMIVPVSAPVPDLVADAQPVLIEAKQLPADSRFRSPKPVVAADPAGLDGFRIYGDDDQSSVRDDGTGRVHAVWTVRSGAIIHATIDWSVPDRSVDPSGEHP